MANNRVADILRTYDDNDIAYTDIAPINNNVGIVDDTTFQEMLSKAIGKYIIVEMLIGNKMYVKDGILTQVGESYIILYDQESKTYLSCDIYTIKFVRFFDTSQKPMSIQPYLEEANEYRAMLPQANNEIPMESIENNYSMNNPASYEDYMQTPYSSDSMEQYESSMPDSYSYDTSIYQMPTNENSEQGAVPTVFWE